MDQNQKQYGNHNVVEAYASYSFIQAAEHRIFESLNFKEMEVMDIGCGAGRTSEYLIPLVKSYVGIDYAKGMIDYCRSRFSDDGIKFEQLDARDMSNYGNETFDVVFFSFNGIDCVSYTDRMTILEEMKRLLKPQGRMIFSFHNANYVHHHYTIQQPNNIWSIGAWHWEYKKYKKIKNINGPKSQYVDRDYFIIKTAEDCTVDILYILPERQLKDVRGLGLELIKAYDSINGTLLEERSLNSFSGPSVYFVLSKK